MTDEKTKRQFATWFNSQLRQRGWTQGKLIVLSGTSEEERLSSAAVSRYSTGKMLPDAASCQRIARALDLPVELVLQMAGFLDAPSEEADWVQQAIDDLAHAVVSGQLSEEGRLAIIANIRRERRLQELEGKNSIA